jgi:hypothetical protein
MGDLVCHADFSYVRQCERRCTLWLLDVPGTSAALMQHDAVRQRAKASGYRQR